MTIQKKGEKIKTKRIYGNSVIGLCHTCGKEFEDYEKRREAYKHAKKTGHKVTLEITINFHYN